MPSLPPIVAIKAALGAHYPQERTPARRLPGGEPMPGPRYAFAAVLLAVLACASAAPVLSAEQRIALVIGISRYADSPLANLVNDAPPTIWDGIWTGKAPVSSGRQCKRIFAVAAKIILQVRGSKITGKAIGRSSASFNLDILGELLADGSWRAHGRGVAYAKQPLTIALLLSGDFTAGKGVWKETIAGCGGELTLSRNE